MSSVSFSSLLCENVMIGGRSGFILAAGGALMGKALTVIGAANIDPYTAAAFGALQPVAIRVIHAVGCYYNEDNKEVSHSRGLTQVGLGILGGYAITTRILKYSLTPMEALLTDLGLAALIALCSAVGGEILYHLQDHDEKLKCYEKIFLYLIPGEPEGV